MNNINISGVVIDDEEIEAAVSVLKSKRVVQGVMVEEFEAAVSMYLQENNVESICVNSGTSALYLSLIAMDFPKGSEIIVPSFTFAASANVIVCAGYTPVFIDIDEYYAINVDKIEELITDKTVAIMPVHLYGQSVRIDDVLLIAQKYNIAVIEDAAQAFGAKYNNKYVGTFGDVGCYSFYPTKNIHTLEGGLVVTKNKSIARKIRLLRNQGMLLKYQNEICGYNNRMTDLSAAIGLVQLKKLDSFISKRRYYASQYNNRLSYIDDIIIPKVYSNAFHTYNQYTIRTKLRDKLKVYLNNLNIKTEIYYPVPVHRLRSFNLDIEYLYNTNMYVNDVLSIPVHPLLTDDDAQYIINSIIKFYN